MGIFKALGKATARSANDKYTNRKVEKAPKVAFKNVGTKINKAKENNKFINGSAEFKKEVSRVKRNEIKKGERREKFIDDL